MHSKKENHNREKAELSLLERYLAVEIGIEFKACLYFFYILFFILCTGFCAETRRQTLCKYHIFIEYKIVQRN